MVDLLSTSCRRLIHKMRRNISRREVIRTHILTREALVNARKFDNVRKDLAYPAMSPRLYFHFSGDHVLLVLHVHLAHLRVTRATVAS